MRLAGILVHRCASIDATGRDTGIWGMYACGDPASNTRMVSMLPAASMLASRHTHPNGKVPPTNILKQNIAASEVLNEVSQIALKIDTYPNSKVPPRVSNSNQHLGG
jgi:hypothetical protein